MQAKHFQRKGKKVVYCSAVMVWKLFLTGWIVKTYMWG